jgi:hypothetical protein
MKLQLPVRLGLASVLLALALPVDSAASDEPAKGFFSLDDVSGRIDLRVYLTEGERGWLKDGFGKTRYGHGDSLEGGLALANAALVWKPEMPFDLYGYVHAQANPGQYNGVDLVEAYLKWKPVPDSETRFSGRAGIFFPPVSMEHDGIAWTTTRTLTPSAINSWIGEEVLVLGLEGSARTLIDEHELTLTGAVFRNNDTSGTLLTYRGWAMHDVLATAFGDFALPDRGPVWNAFYATQAPTTEPFREVDGRYGSYVRLDWSPPAAVTFNITYYDNHGNPEVVEEGQYGWRTRFVNIGVSAELDENTELLAQYMNGETVMGHYMIPGGWMADMGYSSAYVLLSHKTGFGQISGRADWFETTDRTYADIDNNFEEGWAVTLAYQKQLNKWARVAVEGLYIDSDRPARADQGADPEQDQFLLQAAIQFELR